MKAFLINLTLGVAGVLLGQGLGLESVWQLVGCGAWAVVCVQWCTMKKGEKHAM